MVVIVKKEEDILDLGFDFECLGFEFGYEKSEILRKATMANREGLMNRKDISIFS